MVADYGIGDTKPRRRPYLLSTVNRVLITALKKGPMDAEDVNELVVPFMAEWEDIDKYRHRLISRLRGKGLIIEFSHGRYKLLFVEDYYRCPFCETRLEGVFR